MSFRNFAQTIGIPAFVVAMVALIDPMASAQPPAKAPAAQSTKPATAAPKPAIDAELAQAQDALARQTMVAENARKEVDRLRAELKLKDELLALGIQRNAELYAIASEIANKGLSNNGLEPFVQGQRVQMENLRQSYEDQLRAARMYPETLAPSVEKQMKEELAAEKPAGS